MTEELWKSFPDQINPLVYPHLHCDMRKEFPGTMIRLPLRNVEQSAKSLVSHESFTVEQMRETLLQLSEVASHLILFLKNVEQIGISIIDSSSSSTLQLTNLCDVRIRNNDSHTRTQRSIFNQLSPSRRISTTFEMDLIITSHHTPASSREECWLIHSCSVDPKASSNSSNTNKSSNSTSSSSAEKTLSGYNGTLTLEELEARSKQTQYASVAALLRTTAGDSTEYTSGGRVYCFLPIPMESGLPIHINSLFALSSNRRSIWFGESSSASSSSPQNAQSKSKGRPSVVGDVDVKGEWNQYALGRTVPLAYVQLLEDAKNRKLDPLHFYSFFPDMKKIISPFDRVARGVALEIVKHPFFYSEGEWLLLNEVYLETSESRNHLGKHLRSLLKKLKIHLCDPPANVRYFLSVCDLSWKVTIVIYITDILYACNSAKIRILSEDFRLEMRGRYVQN